MTRKLPLFAALSAALFFLSISAERIALARIVGGTTTTTVTQPDQVCFGGSNQGTANPATEVCLDWSGYWVPTTDNSQKLGTSSLRWSDVEAAAINSGAGALSVGGALTVAGDTVIGTAPHKSTVTASGIMIPPNWTLAQIQAYTPTTTEIGGLVVCVNCASPYAICQSTGNVIQGFRAGVTGTTECK